MCSVGLSLYCKEIIGGKAHFLASHGFRRRQMGSKCTFCPPEVKYFVTAVVIGNTKKEFVTSIPTIKIVEFLCCLAIRNGMALTTTTVWDRG